jgi:hypothetical protein
MTWGTDVRLAMMAAALLALASPAWAAGDIHNGTDPVPGHPGMTYIDLIKQVAPDLAKNSEDNAFEGHLAVNPRHIAGADEQGGPSDNSVTLGFVEERRIKVGGKPRIAVLADLGPKEGEVAGLALLMLFTDTPKPKLLDDADVGMDKDSVLSQHVVLPLGPGDDALVTYSEHDDADLTMGGYVLISPVGDHLQLIQFMQLTSVVACGWSDMESTKFSTLPDPGRAYRKIVVRVSSRFRHTDPSCGASDVPKAHSVVFSGAYRWNAAARRFDTTSHIEAQWKAYNDAVFK